MSMPPESLARSCHSRWPNDLPPTRQAPYARPSTLMTPPPPRAALSLVLGAVLALPATTVSAHPFASAVAPATPRERSQAMLAEGDAAYAKDRLEEAISKYRASYYGLPPEDQASYLGSMPVRKAMRAFDQLRSAEADPAKARALLQRQRVLLIEFLDAVAAKPGAAEEVGEDVIAELEELRRSIDQALEADAKPDEPVVPATDPTDDPAEPERGDPDPAKPAITTPPLTDDPNPPRDWLGLGLIIGGSTTLVAGVGVTIGYFTIRSGAQALVDAGGDEYAPGSQAREDYLEQEHARAQPFLIAGSVVAGVGLAVAVGGVVRLVLHRRRATASKTTALQLAPHVTPTAAGLTLHRRF